MRARSLRSAVSSQRLSYGLIAVVLVVGALGGGPVGHAAPDGPSSSATKDRGTVLVLGAADDSLTLRVTAELELLGYEVVQRSPSAALDPATLTDIARAEHASAAIWVDDSREELEIWVVDRVTGKTLLRRVPLDAHEREVAVRAVELLWAGLLELERDPTPVAGEVPPPPASQTLLRPPDPRFGVGLFAAVAGAPGGLGAAVFLRGELRFMPQRRVGVQVLATAPLTAARAEGEEGQVDARIGWVTVGPRVAFGRPRGAVQAGLGLGIGPGFFGVVGLANPSYESHEDLVVVGVAELSGALEVGLTPHLWLHFSGAVGACLPVPAIVFAERRVAHWCLPYGMGAGGIAYTW